MERQSRRHDPALPAGRVRVRADLAQATDLGVHASHQVTDIPADVQAQTIQYDRHAVTCACGQVHVAPPPGGVTGAPGTVTYGLRLQAWCVFLMVMHHVPVQRCADILESLTGTRPSDGWVHALLERAARAVATANKLIRTLIILACVICSDETPIRVGPGPKTSKKYLLVACTNLLTYYFLGGRDLGTFNAFVLPDLTGVIVHDRYQNYDKFPGVLHQLCTAHLLRDLEDAAQAYPDAIWPGQAADALRALIHAANTARAEGLGRVPAGRTAGDLLLFRRGVTVGLSQVRRVPGPNRSSRRPGCCWNACATVSTMCSASSPTCASRPRPTRPNATCARRRHSRRSPAGSPPNGPPATATPYAATCPPPPSTAPPSLPPSSAPSPGTPGCRPSRSTPEPCPPAITQRNQTSHRRNGLNVYQQESLIVVK